MRRLWLERGGVIWDLTSNNKTLLNGNFMGDPAGLGVKVKVDFFEIEHAAFIENIRLESVDISGKLYFYSYEHFERFVAFIQNLESRDPMRLYYTTDDSAQYNDPNNPQWYKLVHIRELQKGEISVKQGCLVCNVKFTALSRWKKDRTITLELSRFGQSFTYPFFYPYFYGGRNNFAVEIDNRGNLPTSCIVRIDAETDTPFFRILQNNVIIEQARYNVYIRSGSHMIINSAPDAQEASIYTTVGGNTIREDIYNTGERDYRFSNFITIPSGMSMFMITATNADFGRCTLSYSLQKELI
jgi:hypothetical protein